MAEPEPGGRAGESWTRGYVAHFRTDSARAVIVGDGGKGTVRKRGDQRDGAGRKWRGSSDESVYRARCSLCVSASVQTPLHDRYRRRRRRRKERVVVRRGVKVIRVATGADVDRLTFRGTSQRWRPMPAQRCRAGGTAQAEASQLVHCEGEHVHAVATQWMLRTSGPRKPLGSRPTRRRGVRWDEWRVMSGQRRTRQECDDRGCDRCGADNSTGRSPGSRAFEGMAMRARVSDKMMSEVPPTGRRCSGVLSKAMRQDGRVTCAAGSIDRVESASGAAEGGVVQRSDRGVQMPSRHAEPDGEPR